MNKIREVYCRVFQTCFKLALPVLPYRKPGILKSVYEVPRLLEKKRVERVLLVTDKSIRNIGLTEELEMCLRANDIEPVIYDRTVANPTTTNVEEARALYLENECLAIIGFGGGSPIDCAKAVGARIAKPNQPLRR